MSGSNERFHPFPLYYVVLWPLVVRKWEFCRRYQNIFILTRDSINTLSLKCFYINLLYPFSLFSPIQTLFYSSLLRSVNASLFTISLSHFMLMRPFFMLSTQKHSHKYKEKAAVYLYSIKPFAFQQCILYTYHIYSQCPEPVFLQLFFMKMGQNRLFDSHNYTHIIHTIAWD